MKIIYMPAGQGVWIDIAKNFKSHSITPEIWLGDPIHNNFAKAEFPECEVVNFSEIHKKIDLVNHSFNVDSGILLSKEFYRLKDQVYKIMDRQDDLGIYNRLDREAFFYYLYCYFFNTIKKIK